MYNLEDWKGLVLVLVIGIGVGGGIEESVSDCDGIGRSCLL